MHSHNVLIEASGLSPFVHTGSVAGMPKCCIDIGRDFGRCLSGPGFSLCGLRGLL